MSTRTSIYGVAALSHRPIPILLCANGQLKTRDFGLYFFSVNAPHAIRATRVEIRLISGALGLLASKARRVRWRVTSWSGAAVMLDLETPER